MYLLFLFLFIIFLFFAYLPFYEFLPKLFRLYHTILLFLLTRNCLNSSLLSSYQMAQRIKLDRYANRMSSNDPSEVNFRDVYIEVCRLKPRGGHLSMRKVHRHRTCGCVRMQEKPTLLEKKGDGVGMQGGRCTLDGKRGPLSRLAMGQLQSLHSRRASFLHFKRTSPTPPLIDYGRRIRLLSPLLTRVSFQPVRFQVSGRDLSKLERYERFLVIIYYRIRKG